MSSVPPPTGDGGGDRQTPVVKDQAYPAIAPRTFWQRLRDGLSAALRAFRANFK